MDLLQGKVKNIYFKYLVAAFGSAMITSIYSIVDMAMVGQYQGPTGTAALAVVAPIWNIIYSLGLLTGIGGSVLYSHARGKSTKEEANEFFTVAFIGTVLFAVASWVAIVFFEEPLLMLFGANEALLPLAQDYMKPIRFAIPLFVFNQMFAAFLRNDNRPALATGAVLADGIFNVVGDYVFVFTCNLGIYGAGLATALGSLITFLVMLSHFFSKKNTLRLVLPHKVFWRSKRILTLGFSTFFIDIAMGILTMMFNRQIMHYFGTDALSVYGIIVNISTLVQCCAYSVGQAAQPIISINHGAKQGKRIQETLKYALQTVAIFSLLWTAVILAVPNLFIYIFMAPTASVHCTGHFAKLRDIVPIAATEYFLYILLSIHYESGRFVLCFGGARHCHQRHHDLYAATTVWRLGAVVCHANHRGNRCGGRSVLDDPIYA